jgi:hypothetical protein
MAAPQWNIPKLTYPEYGYGDSADRRKRLLSILMAELQHADKLIDDDETCNSVKTINCILAAAEYLYVEYGRPACFVPGHLAELFLRSKYAVNSNELKLPLDSFQLVMPAGYRLSDGTALTAIHVFRLCSKLGRELLARVKADIPNSKELREIERSVPQIAGGSAYFPYLQGLGETMSVLLTAATTRIMAFPYIEGRQIGCLPLDADLTSMPEPLNIPGTTGIRLSAVAVRAVKQLTVASLCRYTARPEMVKSYVLPRSERYNHKGDKGQKKIFCFLDPKVIGKRMTKSGEEPTYTVKPHVRGFVYATLRDERWYRKNPLQPGEPLRIQEREPTIIHPEEFEKQA